MKIRALIVAAILLSAGGGILCGAPVLTAEEKPETLFEGSVQDDHIAEAPVPFKNPEALREIWKFREGTEGPFREVTEGPLFPVVSDGKVFAGNATPVRRAAIMVCLNPETGRENWRTRLEGDLRMLFTPDPRGEGVYCVTGEWAKQGEKLGRVFGLDKGTGRILWRAEFYGEPGSPPVVSDSHIYSGFMSGQYGSESQKAFVLCLDKKNGEMIWSFNAESNIVDAPPVLHEGRLYLTSGIGSLRKAYVHCLDTNTGQPIWKYETEGYLENSGAVPDGNRIIILARGVDNRGLVLCLETGSGKLLWKSDLGRAHVSAPPVVSDGRVYIATREANPIGTIQCLDAGSGETVWTFAADESNVPGSSPVVSGNHVYAQAWAAKGGYVYGLDRASGEVLWRYQVKNGEGTDAPLVVFGDHLFASGLRMWSGYGGLFCLDKNTGKLKRRLSSERAAPSRPVFDGGMLFFGTTDGLVYAYREGNLVAARAGLPFILGGIFLLFLFGILQEPIHKRIDRKTGGPAYERKMSYRKRLAFLERTFAGASRLARSLSGGARLIIVNVYWGWLLLFLIILMPLTMIYYLLVIIPWDPWLPRWWPLAAYGFMGAIIGMIVYLA